MTRTGSRWLLLILGTSFWICLATAGTVFGAVAGMSDLRPTVFLVVAIPLWVLAVSSTSKHHAWIGSFGGVGLALLCTILQIPLHVRALHWYDACRTKDQNSCEAFDAYLHDRSPPFWFDNDVIQSRDDTGYRLSDRTLKSWCRDGDLNACSQLIDRGFYPDQRLACKQVIEHCTDISCDGDRLRCGLVLNTFHELEMSP